MSEKYPKHMDLWVTEEMGKELDAWAGEEDRSRAWLVRYLIQRGLDERKVEKAGEDWRTVDA